MQAKIKGGSARPSVNTSLKKEKRYSQSGKSPDSVSTSGQSPSGFKKQLKQDSRNSLETNLQASGTFQKYLRVYRPEEGTSPRSKKSGAQINQSILSERSKAQEESLKQVSFEEDQFEAQNHDFIAKLYDKMKISSPQTRQSQFKISSIQSGRPDISPSNPSQWSVNQREEMSSDFAETTPFQLMIQRMKQIPQKTESQQQRSESRPSIESPTRIHRIELPGTTPKEKAKFLQMEQESFDKDYNELEDLNSSYVIGEENLSEIATLLSTARQKNQVLKSTLTLLRKHNYLLDKENKILKKRVSSNELLNSKLEAELKLREQELIGLQAEVERREKRMKDVLKSIQEQNSHQNQQNAAKLDALVAQVDSKNRRIKDYKREAEALKSELESLKNQQEEIQKTVSMSETLRVGMHAVINDRRKDFKVFCRVNEDLKSEILEFKLPELSLGVSPSEIHVLNILQKNNGEEEEEEEPREIKFYFDGLFPQATSQKEIFMKTKEITKGIARGDQVCFIFLNNELNQSSLDTKQNSLLSLTFDFLEYQVKALSNLGNKMKILCRTCPDAKGKNMFTMSGGLKGISGLKGSTSKKQPSTFLKLNESTEAKESLVSSFRFDQSWTEVTKFKDVMSLITQHKEYERKEKEVGEAAPDVEDFVIYQLRVKSETDDYLGIFRVLTVFEIRGNLILNRDISEDMQSQKSASRLMMSSLASFERTAGEGNSLTRLSQMPQRLLRVISELVNRNEFTSDLEEVRVQGNQQSLFQGKNILFLDLKEQDALELASMSGALMEV